MRWLNRIPVVVMLFLTGFGPAAQESCPAEWWSQSRYLAEDFLDTREVASFASRVSLAPVLIEMFRAFRAVERADFPACAADIRRSFLDAAMTDIAMYEVFMANIEGGDVYVDVFRDMANEAHHDVYERLLEAGATPDGRMYSAELDTGE